MGGLTNTTFWAGNTAQWSSPARPFLGVFSLCRSAAVAFAVPPSNVLSLASLLSFCGLSRAPPVPPFSPRTPSSTISNSAKGWPRSRLADYIDPTASDTPYCSCFQHRSPSVLYVSVKRVFSLSLSLKMKDRPFTRTHARRSTTSSSPQFVLVARCPEKRNTERQQRNSSRIRSQERRERSPPLLPSEEPEPQPRRDSRLVGRLVVVVTPGHPT